ncbi:MAG: hypothetical protein IKK33_08135 [Lachnospiraceae bacterium]|nr:hypothetical protein [Lachnospiraceae bacterium]
MFGKKGKNEITVKLNELPALTEQEQFSLVEIEDKNVISRIMSAVPEAAKVVANSAVAAEGLQLAKSGVYMAKLPSGAQLVKSQEMQGAVRGFFKSGSTIKGQANFLSVDGTMEKIAQMNLANVAMGAASMVVGQYYMKQINTELLAVNNGISKLTDFQDNEYKSKVLALSMQVKRIADYKTEIIENAELRKEEILRLQTMEKDCMELLAQANLTVEQLCGHEFASYDSYCDKVSEIAKWQQYQKALIELMYMIADLNYVLHLGAMSQDQAYVTYTSMYNQTSKMIERLHKWHTIHTKKFGVDVDRAVLERKGLDALLHKPLGLIDEGHNYKKMSKNEVVNIRNQVNTQVENRLTATRDLFDEDVRVVFKDGKVFYLVG